MARAGGGPSRGRGTLASMSQSLPELAVQRYRGRAIGGRRPEQGAKRTRRQNVVALSGVPLFSGLGKRDLNRLAAEADELEFLPG